MKIKTVDRSVGWRVIEVERNGFKTQLMIEKTPYGFTYARRRSQYFDDYPWWSNWVYINREAALWTLE